MIGYDFHTGPPADRGGWAGSVPHPEEDGVWFHLDFHDPESTAQIHPQPFLPPRHYREKKVMLLILEGEATKKIAGALNAILEKHGVAPGNPEDFNVHSPRPR